MEQVGRIILGKDEQIKEIMLSFLANGHILLEDIPGVGKTTMALAFSKAMALKQKRVQFTPDVLPSDVTGFYMFQKETKTFRYVPGPVMTNLFLADEINRTSSKTQSALLEAMEEGSVTVDGVTHPIPRPFTVIATQNPAGSAGTQLLPDSQMDRFMVRLSIGYPRPEDEREMLRRRSGAASPLAAVQQALGRGELLAMREQVDAVYIDDAIYDYIIRLNAGTRAHPKVMQGASPRASLAVAAMARAAAYVQGRDYVVPADVRLVYRETVAHRLLLTPEAESAGASAAAVLDELLKGTMAPRTA